MNRYPAFLRRLVFLCFALLCLVSIGTQHVEASDKKVKTIRVGYPLQEGLTMCDEEGNYSGYTYEYLMEIAQYTGWKYEFVQIEGDLNEQMLVMLDMLKNGELDLLGGMNYKESLTEMYSYPGYNYGTNYRGIFVPDDSDFTESGIYTRGRIRVGVYSKTLEKNEKLEQFAQMNNLDVEQVLTDNHDVFSRMKEDGTVDGLLSTNLAMAEHSGMRAVARFSPSPFYFASTKGNVEVVRQLDYAISTIEQVNPNFAVQLFNEYFSSTSSEMNITKEEKAFVEESGILEVVMYDNKPPFQYADSENGKPSGITVEILDAIAKSTGLEFHYNMVSTFEKYQKMLKSGEVDISADSLLNYQDALESDSALSIPWSTLPIYLIFKDGAVLKEKSSYAVPYFLRNSITDLKNVIYYDTVLACMDAVSSGEVDGCYVGEFCSQYYFNSGAFRDLKYLNMQDSMIQRLCFGIVNKDEFYLISLFNKAITHLSEDKKQEIIYRNTYQQQYIPMSVYLENNKDTLAIIAMGIIIVMFSVYIYIKSRKQRAMAFDNRRYHTLSNLANEYFYEYDVSKDILALSEKCADYFSCSRYIERFRRHLKEYKEQERIGIWRLGEYIVEGIEESTEISCPMQDNSRTWLRVVSTMLYRNSSHAYVIGKVTDIQDVKVEQIRLKQQASLDGLTGIYNIATIKQMIKKRLENIEDSSSYALIILDIDNFKQINDHFGHYNGDAVLIQVANLISNIFHPHIAGRLGGDEFLIFTENMSKEEIRRRCEVVCETTAEKTYMLLDESSTLSIGIAFTENGQSYEDLYRQADTALYQIKSKTKNGFSFFEES